MKNQMRELISCHAQYVTETGTEIGSEQGLEEPKMIVALCFAFVASAYSSASSLTVWRTADGYGDVFTKPGNSSTECNAFKAFQRGRRCQCYWHQTYIASCERCVTDKELKSKMGESGR